jgi:O-acetyl-ADP-ribose deacetylase (regulator of RNase III)
LKDIKDGLKNLKHNPHNFNSISLPALGCGLGGLKLLEVKKIMEYIFSDVDYRVELVIRE